MKQRDGLLPYFPAPIGQQLPAPGAAGGLLRSDGSAWERADIIPTPGADGEFIRSDGTDWESAAAIVRPWFEWNGTDLTQFGTAVAGANVTGHTESVVSLGGFNWISMEVTTNGGNSVTGGVVLPIAADPPGADYGIVYEFIVINSLLGTNLVGAGGLVRYTSLTSAYSAFYNNTTGAGAGTQVMGRFGAGPAPTNYQNMDDPRFSAVNRGTRIGLSAQSGAGDASALLRMIIGEPALYFDKTPITATGQAALWKTNASLVGTSTVLFRNIKCFTASDMASFEL